MTDVAGAREPLIAAQAKNIEGARVFTYLQPCGRDSLTDYWSHDLAYANSVLFSSSLESGMTVSTRPRTEAKR